MARRCVDAEVGNTRTSASIYWTFTLNNFTDIEFNILKDEIRLHCIDYRVQEEIGESNTPHLQGYIQAKKKIRPMETFSNKRIHWEKARSPKHARKYCCKEDSATGNYVLDTVEPIILTKPDHPWQLEVLELITKPPDRRIHWYWDYEGGVGKSTLAKWICYHYNAICVSGKAADCKYAIVAYHEKQKKYPKIIILDIPRSTLNDISYDGIEAIENGCFFSGKYESCQVIMNNPHIIIFANAKPNTSHMSTRKWDIIEIKIQKEIPDQTIHNNTLNELQCQTQSQLQKPYDIDILTNNP